MLFVPLMTGNGLYPEADCACRWDLLQVFCILYMAAVVPVRVGFDFVATGGWFYFELVIDIYFWIDLVLNFITAYPEDDLGKMVVGEAPIQTSLSTLHQQSTYFSVPQDCCCCFDRLC